MSNEPKYTLYRFYDATGVLLYIGRTVDARSRFRSHERSKEWFDSVARIEREILPSAEVLARAEVDAIQAEGPLHNVQHSTRPRPVQPTVIQIDDEDDPRVFRRLASVEGLTDEFPQTPCGEDEVGSGCNCIGCIRAHLAEVDRMREQHEDDHPLVAVFDKLERRYLDGWDSVDWVYDLDDAQMFRRWALRTHSAITPAPALAFISDNVVQVGCPFCSNLHDHVVIHGGALDELTAPCLGNGTYRPVLDYGDYLDRAVEWHDGIAA